MANCSIDDAYNPNHGIQQASKRTGILLSESVSQTGRQTVHTVKCVALTRDVSYSVRGQQRYQITAASWTDGLRVC